MVKMSSREHPAKKVSRRGVWSVAVIAVGILSPFISFAAPGNESTESRLNAMDSRLQRLEEVLTTLASSMKRIESAVTSAPNDEENPIRDVTVTLDRSSGDDFALGKANAPITIMEFLEFQCPYCSLFYHETYPQLKSEYLDTGKVKIVYRDFITPNHANASQASSFVACAGHQDKFIRAMETLFDHPDMIAAGKFLDLFTKVGGLDGERFSSCLQSPKYALADSGTPIPPSREAQEDINEGKRIGIQGTPSFFIFRTPEGKGAEPLGEVKGKLIRGAQSFELFKQTIDGILNEGK